MQYNGFISTLIERSEHLVLSDPQDDLNVTRSLLLLSAGFTLVRDRISSPDNTGDRGLRSTDLKRDFKKASASGLIAPIKVEGREFFEDFRTCGDWVYVTLDKEVSERPSAHNIGTCIFKGEVAEHDTLKLDHPLRALRNAFAHGSVFPMSHPGTTTARCRS